MDTTSKLINFWRGHPVTVANRSTYGVDSSHLRPTVRRIIFQPPALLASRQIMVTWQRSRWEFSPLVLGWLLFEQFNLGLGSITGVTQPLPFTRLISFSGHQESEQAGPFLVGASMEPGRRLDRFPSDRRSYHKVRWGFGTRHGSRAWLWFPFFGVPSTATKPSRWLLPSLGDPPKCGCPVGFHSKTKKRTLQKDRPRCFVWFAQPCGAAFLSKRSCGDFNGHHPSKMINF